MKKIVFLLGLTFAAAFFLFACSSDDVGCCAPPVVSRAPAGSTQMESAGIGAYHRITAEDAKKMLDEGGVTVVDVRTAEEYAEKHIPGAVLVPVASIGDELPAALPNKDAILLVYCRTGVRSKQASDRLMKLGYANVYDFGGIVDWTYETESGDVR